MTGVRAVLGFDTETTGINMTPARIVSAALVWRDADGEMRERSWLINPGVPIPPEASRVHGITDASGGQHPTVALDEIASELARGWPVVAFNAQFDFTVLDSELRRHALEPLTARCGPLWPVLDPLMFDWGLWPDRRGKRTLAALCDRYKCVPPLEWHDATQDARAAVNLFDRICDIHPELNDTPLSALIQFQQIAHQGWISHLNKSRSDHGRSADAIRGWPFAERDKEGDHRERRFTTCAH